MLKKSLLAAAALAGLSNAAARAVIIADQSVGATGRNTSAPTGSLAGSGWDLQGAYGAYLGTPVSSTWFITANHFGAAGSTITLPDGAHNLTGNSVVITGTDLVLREVSSATPFTSYAPIYNPAVDSPLLLTDTLAVFGRGTQRGAEVSGKGWQWGASDSVKSWGTNTPDGFAAVTTGDGTGLASGTQFLVADFDQISGGSNEATLSDGDSGGGVFVQRDGVWKLVGINYGVDAVFTDNGVTHVAAYDEIGLKRETAPGSNTYTTIAGTSPKPQQWEASYVPASFAAVQAVIPEPASLGIIGVTCCLIGHRRRRAN